MPGGNKFYWDSCVFIAWLKDEMRPVGEMDGVRRFVQKVKRREISIMTSALTLVEVSEAKVAAGVMTLLDDLFKRPNLGQISVDIPVAKLARELRDFYLSRPDKYQKTLSVPDAIHLATAILYKADAFHTFDASNRHGTLGLLKLSGNVAGHGLIIERPLTEQPSLDLPE